MNEKWNQYFFGEPTEEEKTGAFSGIGKERRYETGICRNAKIS